MHDLRCETYGNGAFYASDSMTILHSSRYRRVWSDWEHRPVRNVCEKRSVQRVVRLSCYTRLNEPTLRKQLERRLLFTEVY